MFQLSGFYYRAFGGAHVIEIARSSAVEVSKRFRVDRGLLNLPPNLNPRPLHSQAPEPDKFTDFEM